jgi:nitrate/nitrite transport system ATP-binding protein
MSAVVGVSPEPFLEFSQLGQVFQTRRGTYEALRDINLSIRQGEFIGVIGHSGCGK